MVASAAGPPGRRGLYLGATEAGPLIGGSEQGALILGPPRSGKTSTLVIPNVLAAPGAVVCTSTKPDVLDATMTARGRVGRCWLYDPSDTVHLPPGVVRLRWSPVSSARAWDGALLTARAMVRSARPGRGLADASHWTERAEALLATLLHAAALSGADVAAVMGWVNRREPEVAQDVLWRKGASTAGDLLEGIAATDERELSGIWSTASGVLAAYRLDAALAQCSEPNFDPGGFVSGSDTVYVCATGRHQAMVAPLVVGLLEEIRAAAYARAAEGDRTGGPGTSGTSGTSGASGTSGPGVLLALDEVANIAPLPDLPSIVAEGGSQGLITLACLQDLSQGRARWGDAADGFGSLFGATVVLPGIGDVRTLQAISDWCGQTDVRVRSDTRGRSGWRPRPRSRSVTWSTRRQPRIGVDDVGQGRTGAALVIGGPDPPTWVDLAPYWQAEPWRSLAGEPGREPVAAPRDRGWWGRRSSLVRGGRSREAGRGR